MSPFRTYLIVVAALTGWLQALAATPPAYTVVKSVDLPGEGGWDDLTFEPGRQRLFIAHSTRVDVIDTQRLVRIGEIADTPGVHGIALAPELGRGYISAGGTNSVVVFDLATLARLKDIRVTGENPDAIVYEPATRRVLSFNGRSHNATVIDAASYEVVGTIELAARPEFARVDGQGLVYVNLEDKGSIAVIDARTMAVKAVWPVKGCAEPSGLALDVAGQRLFAVCDNHVMAVVDARTGTLLGTASIGSGVDGAGFDPILNVAFASAGQGQLDVVDAASGTAPHVLQSLATQRGARTMTLDEKGHRVFLVTADFGATPAATAEHPHPRPAILPGTFRLLVAAPQPAKP